MSAKLGDAITKKLTTGRLYFQRKTSGTYESNWLDFGNCVTSGYKPEVQRADHMKSAGGFKRVDLSLVKSIKPLFSCELDEITPDLERLRQLASAGTDVVQSSGTTTDEVLVTSASLKGRTYFAAKQGLSAVTVKVSSTAKTLDVDYSIDLGSGAVTILPDSTIANNSTVTITYTAAAITTVKHTAFSELRTEGRFKFIETDQHSAVPRATTTFEGQCHVSNWGDNATEDYTKTTLECLPLTDPVVNTRKD
jgi:hypothetical protein